MVCNHAADDDHDDDDDDYDDYGDDTEDGFFRCEVCRDKSTHQCFPQPHKDWGWSVNSIKKVAKTNNLVKRKYCRWNSKKGLNVYIPQIVLVLKFTFQFRCQPECEEEYIQPEIHRFVSFNCHKILESHQNQERKSPKLQNQESTRGGSGCLCIRELQVG